MLMAHDDDSTGHSTTPACTEWGRSRDAPHLYDQYTHSCSSSAVAPGGASVFFTPTTPEWMGGHAGSGST